MSCPDIRCFILPLLFLLAALRCPGAPLSEEQFGHALQVNSLSFQKVDLPGTGSPVDLSLKLRPNAVKIDGAEYDGFRFTAPTGSDTLDWVWYFNIPANWGNWYIVPVQGIPGKAFVSLLDADKAYQDLDLPGEAQRLRVLQVLPSGYFHPGEDYVIWFRKLEPGTSSDLKARIFFAKNESEWNFASLEKVLGLKVLPLTAQVEHLKSRGGKILFDETFFENGYAEERTESIFASMRRSKELPNGGAGMEISAPPLKSPPSYKDIRQKYGEADFVVTADESKQAWKSQGYQEEKGGEMGITTYYYDYLGFEVRDDDPEGKVRRVITSSSNYANLIPKESGDAFGRLPSSNLTVFYRDKKEVGRIYNFLAEKKYPLLIQEPPTGQYKKGNEVIEYKGHGEWLWLTSYPDGSTSRKNPLVNNVMEGKAEGFYPSGRPQFIAVYKGGLLNGDFIQYSETGEMMKKQTYTNGILKSSFQ